MAKDQINKAIDDWINYDCPPSGRDSISSTLRELLAERIDAIGRPPKVDIKPPVTPPPEVAKPKPPTVIAKPVLPSPKKPRPPRHKK